MGDNHRMTPDRSTLRAVAVAVVFAVVASVGVAAAPLPADAQTSSVACNIVTGADRPSQQVARLYKAVFHRPPEPEGWNYWKGVITTRSLFDIAAFFVEAPEFTNLYGSATNDEFVRLVYQNVMGREPEPEGYQYWLGSLNRGELTRADMVVYFSESSEFKRRENDVYFETCPRVIADRPSAIISTKPVLEQRNFETRTISYKVRWYTGAFNAADRSSTYAWASRVAGETSYIARRKLGDECVAWGAAESSQVVLDLVTSIPTHFELLWMEAERGIAPDREAAMRDRIKRLGPAAEAVSTTPEFPCEPDNIVLLRMTAARFEVLPDVAADTAAWDESGYVRRTFSLETPELVALVAAGEPTLVNLAPSIEDDLEFVAANNQALRDAGLGHLANDHVSLVVTVWEDATGNMAIVQGQYFAQWTGSDIDVYKYREPFVYRRAPSD